MYSWQFSSQKDRPKQWYVFALIGVLFFVLYGIYEGIYIMSVVAFLFAGVYILMENNATPVTSVIVNENFIQVDTTKYDLSMIDKFTMLSNDGVYVMLRLFVKKSLSATVDIPLTSEVDAYGLKSFLELYLTFDANADWWRGDRIIHAMKL